MELRICTQPQIGASQADLHAVATATRDAGLAGFFRADHLMHMGPGPGLPGPSESFVSLGALAAQVPDIRVGTLVASAGFRHPVMTALAAATLDDISGGRMELGIGSGWFAQEHLANGLPFPPVGERFDRLAEQLEIITGLWATPVGQSFDYRGRHYTLQDASGLPKPIQTTSEGTPKVPIILGGQGPRRTPRLAARFADEFNIANADVQTTARQIARVAGACDEVGRSPQSLTYSAAALICTGADRTSVEARASRLGRGVDDVATHGFAGSPDQVLEKLRQFAQAGVQRIYLQVIDLADLEHVYFIGERIAPLARALGRHST